VSRVFPPEAVVGARKYDVSTVDQVLLSRAKQLAVAERVELINELWASIDADDLPVTPAEAALIDQRLAEANAEPLTGKPWEEVEAALRSRLR